MKAIFAFLIGIFLGTGGFYYYISYKSPKSDVLSEITDSTETPEPMDTVSIDPVPTISDEPIEDLFPTIDLDVDFFTPTPTKKIVKSTLTPTKKPPSITPTKSVSVTPTLYITPTLLSTPSLTPTISLTPTPIPVQIQAYTSSEINGFIDRFSGQYGVDPNVLRYIAICESGFNPLAANGAYGGLYQFSAGTWNTYRVKIGEDTNSDLRFNAEEAVQTAAYVISIGMQGIWPHCLP